MKSIYLLIFLQISNICYSQKEAVAIGVGLVAGVSAYENSLNEYEESLELMVTEQVLSEKTEISKFLLKNLRLFDTTSDDDQSSSNYIPFGLTIYKENGGISQQLVLLSLSKGWVDQNGIDYQKTKFHYFEREDFFKLLLGYINLASPLKIEGKGFEYPIIKTKLGRKDKEEDFSKVKQKNGLILYVSKKTYDFTDLILTRKGLDYTYYDGNKSHSESLVRFRRFDEDFYSVADYDETFKIIYNENSLGLFDIRNKELTKINRKLLNTIIEFFMIK